ncbi:MAG TPA: CBS domain-containing protein [Terriglobia bacterium]|nr:CBS domain-containing protein [Terriglobia bacterium]
MKKQKRKQTGKAPKVRVTAKEVMNPSVETVRDDLTVQELAAFLTEKEITGAPVVNERGKLVGVVSAMDIVENAAEGADFVPGGESGPHVRQDVREHINPGDLRRMHVENSGLQVREIMTPTVFTIPEDTPVEKIAQTMISGRVHRLLVTRRGRMVGIVTTLDLLKLLVGKK